MPVSYVSDIIKSNPFVQPFDIELMAKVNSYKQSEFYRNAQKTQNLVSQLNNADIMNDKQRTYTQDRVKNLVGQLNNMGGINYSDMNVTNAIENFTTDIYNDENVLNGIVSTKKIRQWQQNVEKLKTDPKLNKYYNSANEAWDYENHIKPYLQGGVDATYSGPTAPKPYTGNPFTKALDQLKKLRPDITTTIDPVTGNRFFLNKTTNTMLSQEDISAALDGIIDGDTKQQLMIDAWYNYDYSTGGKFDKQMGTDLYTQDIDNATRNTEAELKKINEQIAVEPNLDNKAFYEEEKTKREKYLLDLKEKRGTYINDFAKEWDKDPTSAKYKLYMTRFQQDLIKAAGYSETKHDLIKNEDALFKARLQLEYAKSGLWWDGVSVNHDGTPAITKVAGAEGMGKKTGDVATDKAKEIIGNGIFHDLTVNTEDGKQARSNAVTEDVLLNDNELVDKEQNKILKEFLENTSRIGYNTDKGDLLGFSNTPEANKGAAPTIATSPLLTAIQNIGDNRYLSRSDIEYVVSQVENQEKGMPKGYEKPNYRIRDDKNAEITLTKEQVGFFKNIMKNWDAIATGQISSDQAPMNVSSSDFAAFVKKYQLNEMIKTANLNYIKDVKQQAIQGTGVSVQEYDRYNQLKKKKIAEWGLVLPEFEEYKALDERLTAGNIPRKVKAAFDNASNRLNYYSLYLPEQDVLEKAAPGLLAKARTAAVKAHNDDSPKVNYITRDTDGKFYVGYSWGAKNKTSEDKFEISADEAITLGGQVYPNEPLERLLTYELSSGPLYTYSTAFKQPIKYSIERIGNDRNSRKFMPFIHYKGEKIPVYAPDKVGFQKSANSAEFLLNQYITNNPAGDIETFIAGLKAIHKNY